MKGERVLKYLYISPWVSVLSLLFYTLLQVTEKFL